MSEIRRHTRALIPSFPPKRLARVNMVNLKIVIRGLLAVTFVLYSALIPSAQSAPNSGWPTYANDPGGTRYSSAQQIDRTNVTSLQLTWTYRTGAMDVQTESKHKAAFEATLILVEEKLFLSTPYNRVVALSPQNGARLWEYDPHVNPSQNYSEVTSRGVSPGTTPKAAPVGPVAFAFLKGPWTGGSSP